MGIWGIGVRQSGSFAAAELEGIVPLAVVLGNLVARAAAEVEIQLAEVAEDNQ